MGMEVRDGSESSEDERGKGGKTVGIEDLEEKWNEREWNGNEGMKRELREERPSKTPDSSETTLLD